MSARVHFSTLRKPAVAMTLAMLALIGATLLSPAKRQAQAAASRTSVTVDAGGTLASAR